MQQQQIGFLIDDEAIAPVEASSGLSVLQDLCVLLMLRKALACYSRALCLSLEMTCTAGRKTMS